MVVSPVNLLDTFPYPSNVLDLDISDGDEIIALKSIGDKVLQFKTNMMYVINISTSIPSEFFVEERNKYKGCDSPNHIVETLDGIFWFNKNGVYFYDGTDVKDLIMNADEDSPQRRIDTTIWSQFINTHISGLVSNGTSTAVAAFNPKSKEIIIVKSNVQLEKSHGDCYIYSLVTDSWTRGRGKFYTGGLPDNPVYLTNFVNLGDDGDLYFMYEGATGAAPDTNGSPL